MFLHHAVDASFAHAQRLGNFLPMAAVPLHQEGEVLLLYLLQSGLVVKVQIQSLIGFSGLGAK